jgi:hypothetical protein
MNDILERKKQNTGGACGLSLAANSCQHGAKINFYDLTLYIKPMQTITSVSDPDQHSQLNDSDRHAQSTVRSSDFDFFKNQYASSDFCLALKSKD